LKRKPSLALLGIKRSDIIIMMGDFNAQVGDNNKDTEHIMGRHGMPCESENKNRQLLIEFCGEHGFLIGGTVFPHRDCHKVTWVFPDKDKQVENKIDHICISRNWNKSLLDVQNKRGSDHHMIMGILRIKVQKVKRKATNRKKYNLRKLDDSDSQRTFKARLSKRRGLPHKI
jgi:endonuclease/exonuclease/phosphatase family metal-dependent hydrolase